MSKKSNSRSVTRRSFLRTTGGLIAAAPVVARGGPALSVKPANAAPVIPAPASQRKRIPIGVFDAGFENLPLDAMLEKITAMGLEAVEMGAGGYSGSSHCPVEELLADPTKARAWKKKFEDRNILVGALSCHGNPLHPDPKLADRDVETFRRTVLLAERLEVPVIVGFSGCPGDSPTAKHPNWATYRWPADYDQILKWQWSEKVIPYWKQAAKFAREHGVRKLAFEMHPGFVVYNPKTLLKLRDAVGEEIGANCDLSHLFWQGCDPIEVIHLLAREKALFHAHMKDTVIFRENAAKYGVLNFEPSLAETSVSFRAVGYGHGAELWKDIVRAYMEVGFEGILSIENEDPILPGEEGIRRAAEVLKAVRKELLSEA